MSEFQFSTVDEALEDLKNGKIILVAVMKTAKMKAI